MGIAIRANILKAAAKAAAKTDHRPALQNVCIVPNGDNVSVYGTDGFILFLCENTDAKSMKYDFPGLTDSPLPDEGIFIPAKWLGGKVSNGPDSVMHILISEENDLLYIVDPFDGTIIDSVHRYEGGGYPNIFEFMAGHEAKYRAIDESNEQVEQFVFAAEFLPHTLASFAESCKAFFGAKKDSYRGLITWRMHNPTSGPIVELDHKEHSIQAKAMIMPAARPR